MNEKNINTSLYLSMFFGFVAIACFVGGIPMIIIGAINAKWVLMGIGIACVLFGFYGTPLIWVRFGLIKGKKNILLSIKDGIHNISDLSNTYNKRPKQIINTVTSLIRSRYLVGYKLNEGQTKIIALSNVETQTKQTDELHSAKCTACKAVFEYSNKTKSCPYCGSPIVK